MAMKITVTKKSVTMDASANFKPVFVLVCEEDGKEIINKEFTLSCSPSATKQNILDNIVPAMQAEINYFKVLNDTALESDIQKALVG